MSAFRHPPTHRRPARYQFPILAGICVMAGALPPAQGGTVVLDAVPRAIPAREDWGPARARPREGALHPVPVSTEAAPAVPLALKTAPPESFDGAKNILLSPEEEGAPRWRVRLDYFEGTENGFGGILGGDINTIPQNGFALNFGYVLVEGLWDRPLDLILQGGVMWHDEKGYQSDFLHYNASVKFEWTSFRWDEHLRTRLGFATGWSYADKIPFAEISNRGTTSSQHFLHYLEASLSLNFGDLYRLGQLDHVLRGFESSVLDDTWIVGSVFHRSGAWGFYGEDDNGDDIEGGSNFLGIGIQTEF